MSEENKGYKKKIPEWVSKEIKSANYVIVPKKLILSKDINYKSKYLYIIMKKHTWAESKNIDSEEYKIPKLNIKCETLMKILKWKDKRSFKKYLSELLENGFIQNISKEEINNIKPKTVVSLYMYIDYEYEKYIKLDIELIKQVFLLEEHNHEKGLVYLYYQENLYNQEFGNSDKGYSCPKYDEMIEVLKISSDKLKEIIWLYHLNYICEYYRMDCVFNEEGNLIRPRNRYIVNNIDDIWEGKEFERRYKRHKQAEYFK